MTDDKPQTTLVAAGRMSETHFGAVNTPVYRASTILFPDLAALENRTQEYFYGRRGTPSSRSLEDAICALEGGARTVLVPSGLNACATAILAVVGAGDHLLMVDSCYEPTRDFCDKVLSNCRADLPRPQDNNFFHIQPSPYIAKKLFPELQTMKLLRQFEI